MSTLCERVWQLCDINYYKIRISIDTTVETIFGNQQGGRKGHNTKYRGKRALWPILCFIDETREYLIGELLSIETTTKFPFTIQGRLESESILQLNIHACYYETDCSNEKYHKAFW